MDDLQYQLLELKQVKVLIVLNLVINGWPSILKKIFNVLVILVMVF